MHRKSEQLLITARGIQSLFVRGSCNLELLDQFHSPEVDWKTSNDVALISGLLYSSLSFIVSSAKNADFL